MPKDLFEEHGVTQASPKDLLAGQEEELAVEKPATLESLRQLPVEQQLEFMRYKPSETERMIGEVGLGMAMPGVPIGGALGRVLGRYGSRIAGEAIPQAGLAAAMAPEDRAAAGFEAAGAVAPFAAATEAVMSQSPAVRLLGRLTRSGLGAGMGAAAGEQVGGAPGEYLGGVLGGILGAKGTRRTAERAAARQIKEATEGTPYEQLLDYGNELGFKYLTPAEVTGDVALGKLQGEVRRTPEGGKVLWREGKERMATEKDAWDNILNSIYNPDKFDKLKGDAYKAAHVSTVPGGLVNTWKKDPVIQEAYNDLKTNPAFVKKLEGVPEDSLKYWDYVKRAIYDREKNLKQGTEERAIYSSTRNELVSSLDEISEPYRVGRQLSEREKTKDKLIKAFDDAKIRGTELHKYLAKDKKYDELMYSLRNAPEAQESIEKLKLVTENLINPITPRTAAGYGTTGMFEARSSSKELENLISEKLSKYFAGDSDSKKLAELLVNPNWNKELDKILELTSAEKRAAQALTAAGRGAAQAVPYGLRDEDNR